MNEGQNKAGKINLSKGLVESYQNLSNRLDVIDGNLKNSTDIIFGTEPNQKGSEEEKDPNSFVDLMHKIRNDMAICLDRVETNLEKLRDFTG